jgi:GTP pyrophosphokinase
MTYSNSQLDRAGRTVAEHLLAIIQHDEEALKAMAPSQLAAALGLIESWRRSHARPLSRVAANLRYYAGEAGTPTVTQRLKKLPTVAHKLLREPKMRLSQMADIGGVRAVLPDQDEAYRVASRLRKNWTITRLRDYVADSKPDGYRALHLINRHRGRLIEVQLRTPSQDLWANAVEADARRFDLELKSGGGPAELSEYYVAVSELFAAADQGRILNLTLLKRLARLEAKADTFRERRMRSQ